MTTAGILTWIIFGLIVGLVANLIDPNRDRMGVLGSMVLGILGAALGGLVANLFGFSGPTGFNLYSFIVALLGALVVLWIGRSLYPYQSYGPSYYDDDLTNDELERKTTTVETTERKVHHDDNPENL